MNFRTTLLLAIVAVGVVVAVVLLQRVGSPLPEEQPAEPGRVFPEVTHDGITRIEVRRQSSAESIVLERQDGTWLITSPFRARAERDQVAALVTTLATMAYSNEKEPTEANRRMYGLNPANLTITFTCLGKSYQCFVGDESRDGRPYTCVSTPDHEKILLVNAALVTMAGSKIDEWRDKRLVALSPEEVQSFSITQLQLTTRAERLDRRWKLTAPVVARADADTVRTLLTTLTDLQAVGFASASSLDLSPYGLDDPRIVVTLARKAATPPNKTPGSAPDMLTIRIGRPAPEGGGTYVQVSDSASVALVDEAKVDDLTRAVGRLRDKQALAFGDAQPTYLSIAVDDEAVALERVVGNRWQMVAPRTLPADPDEVAKVIKKLRNLTARQFDDHAARDSGKYGLEAPHGTITYRLEGQSDDTTVFIGKDPKTEQFWVLEAGTSIAARVDADAAAALKTSYLTLCDKTVWTAPAGSSPVELSWHRQDDDVTIRRTRTAGGDSFEMIAPVKQTLDPQKTAALFHRFTTLTADKYVAEITDLAEYGLSAADLVITVTLRGDQGDAKSDVRRQLLVTLHDSRYVAAVADGERIFELSPEVVGELSRPLFPGSWSGITGVVQRLSIEARLTPGDPAAPDLKLDLTRSGQSWTQTGASDAAVHPEHVDWYLGDLQAVQPSQVISYQTGNPAAYGLDKPQWRIRIMGLAMDRTFLISADGPASGGKYATVDGSRCVVVLDGKALADITKDKSFFTMDAKVAP
jgi:hypothetical protein